MDWLDFMAHSEWPIVAGGTIFVLRRQLQTLVDRVNITKVDVWGVKAEFQKSLQEVEKLSPPYSGPSRKIVMPDAQEIDPHATYGEILAKGGRLMDDMGDRMMPTPDTIVLEHWEEFDRQLFDAAGFGDSNHQANRFRRTHRILWDFGLSDNDREAYTILYDLKEKIANSTVPIATWNDVTRLMSVMIGIVNRVKEYRLAHPPG